jgi:hypothetical protein
VGAIYALTITIIIIIIKKDGSSLQKLNGKKPSNQNLEDWPLEEKRSLAFLLFNLGKKRASWTCNSIPLHVFTYLFF